MNSKKIQSKLTKFVPSMGSLKQWYKWKFTIVLLLIFFYPLGLFMMWKHGIWKKRTRWIVTVLMTAFWLFAFWGGYNQPPSISFDNVKDKKVTTDSAQYAIAGNVSSMKAVKLSINDQPVKITKVSEFSYDVPLKEGDNKVTLEAVNDNGLIDETVMIHRTTAAELTARAAAAKFAAELKAEKEKQSQLDAQSKAKAEAKAKSDAEAAKQAQDNKSQQKSLSNNTKPEDKKSFFSWFHVDLNFDWLFGNSPEQKAKQAQEKKAEEAKKKAEADKVAQEKKAKEETEAQKKAQEKAQQEADARKKAEAAYTISDDEVLFTLISTTKDNVKLALKAPSTAKFAGSWLDPGNGWSSTKIDASTVRLYSYVDSQNSFGAMLRSNFSMTWCKRDNNFSVIQFVFDGTTYLDKQCGQ